jgi:DNA-3-methyladenine glycosylase
MKKLERSFYNRTAIEVAKGLLGKYLVHRVNGRELSGKIVETEAYMGPDDKAAHSCSNRRTKRTEVMFGPPGYAYVYLIYGMYSCMNIVASEVESPQAVLIRALEPVKGLEDMAKALPTARASFAGLWASQTGTAERICAGTGFSFWREAWSRNLKW